MITLDFNHEIGDWGIALINYHTINLELIIQLLIQHVKSKHIIHTMFSVAGTFHIFIVLSWLPLATKLLFNLANEAKDKLILY